ncbi:MAG: ice-binding family protein [Sphingobacteriaceae bacterium]|nr:ice-binding family protein [Sphingobacteriaceae bacterium]
MIQKLHILFAFVLLATLPLLGSAQAPNLGSTSKFVLFSTNGAVSNTGITQLTGKVGTNNGSSTGFGNVNGGMHDGDTTSAQAATDLLIAYNQLNAATPGFFPAPLLGNGQVLIAGTYAITGAATLSNELTFNAQNNPNAVFIIQIAGPLSTSANAKVRLINGAQACNVYWKVEGLVDMAAGTFMRGTIIANNAGINMNTLDTLEGRAMSTAGAITVNGVLAYTPIGCGSPVLNGPTAPTLGEAGCYGIFSADGPIQNAGISNILGDVGANVGLTIGFDPLTVTGNIHPIPDGSTALAAADLLLAYTYVNTLSADIELLYPAQFGGNLVLTPHTYVLNGATTLTDSLFLDAQGSANAVFIIKIYGALETSAYARVVLINGTQAKNVYWMVNGAVELADYTTFNGSIISQGAISLFTGTTINGRALTGVGALATNAIQGAADIPTTCQTIVGGPLSVQNGQTLEAAALYPNPFQGQLNIRLSETAAAAGATLLLYNSMGALVLSHTLTEAKTQMDVSQLPAGIYIYRLTQQDQLLQSGRLISQ